MAIKTIQIFEPDTPMDISPVYDRLGGQHEPTRLLHIDLIDRGELPRFRGSETEITATDTEITVVMTWASRAIADEYAQRVTEISVTTEGINYMRSVEVVEV